MTDCGRIPGASIRGRYTTEIPVFSIGSAMHFTASPLNWPTRLPTILCLEISLNFLSGPSVMRPMFFEFSDDPVALNISVEFPVRSSILVCPVLGAGATTVNPYVPKGPCYNLLNFVTTIVRVTTLVRYCRLTAPLDTVNLHVREDSI